MKKRTLFAILAVFLSLVAVILLGVGLWLPSWWTSSATFIETNTGLYRSCVETAFISICDVTQSTDDKFNISTYLLTAGVVLMGLAFFFGLVLLCTKSPCVSITAAIFGIFGGLCGVACVGLFTYNSYDKDLEDKLGTAFILASVGSGLGVIAGILFLCAKPKKGSKEGRVMNMPTY